MSKSPRLTLRQVFALSLAGLVASLALLLLLVFRGSEKSIQESSERLRDMASREVIDRVTNYLNEAPDSVSYFEKQVRYGLVDPGKPESVQKALLSLLLANPNISEASFTYGKSLGFDDEKKRMIDKASAGQVSVFLSNTGSLQCQLTWFDGKRFISKTVDPSQLNGVESASMAAAIPAIDPTLHDTFKTPANKFNDGDLLWTDLHWSQLDEELPETQRRVEMSVLKSINDMHSQFAGVLRIGLMKEQIDRAVQWNIAGANKANPYSLFLCVKEGQLITGFGPGDHVVDIEGDLRISGDDTPEAVKAALQQPKLRSIALDQIVSGNFSVGQTVYLYTFRAWPERETRDWVVGIVVPRDYYLGELLQIRQRVLWLSAALIGMIVFLGSVVLHSIGRAHAVVVRETALMNEFKFSPSKNSSHLRDIAEVLFGLEKAKTAMRAMGKYVPVDLVRRLYHDGLEPTLGGESAELSVLFTDIKGFTGFAEQTEPDRLAELLGRYLQVMATVMQNEKGTIDKFIGDSVMAFWNAPEKVADHSILACRAALKCREALAKLYLSPEWNDAPRFETRFGLHRCTANVGHFGAPDRFNYTAIGDGINLASRLEGLNKYYGTIIIVSEAIYDSAKDHFEFRLLNRVAVKGKKQGIVIYELLTEKKPGVPRNPVIVRYEEAFAAYLRCDFKAALTMLEIQPDDAPSRSLAEQCQRLINQPPAPYWDGIYVFESK